MSRARRRSFGSLILLVAGVASCRTYADFEPFPCAEDKTCPDSYACDTGANVCREVNAGDALQFDGDGQVVELSRLVSTDFTLEAWINTTQSLYGSQYFEGSALVYADVSGVHDDFGTSILNDHFCFGTGDPDTTVESSTTVTTGAWTHVAAVRTMATGTITVLVNGVEEASASTGNTRPLADPQQIFVGGNTIDLRYFGGAIDELRIWSVARTAAEIQATMHQRLTGNDAGLVGYYRFDDAAGLVAADSSPSRDDAALGGGDPTKASAWVSSDAPIFR